MTSPPDLLSRVARGAGALSLGTAINIAGQLIVVPVALYAWGADRYGEWLLLSGLVALLQLSDLGLQNFAVNKMCAAYAQGNRGSLQTALDSALRVQIPVVGGVFLVLAVTLAALPIDRAIGLRTVGGGAFVAVALLLASELLIGVPMGLIAGVYRATGRFPRAAGVGAFRSFALIGVTIALMACRLNFVWVAAARTSIAVIVTVWTMLDLRRLYPWLRIRIASGSTSEGLAMTFAGMHFLLIPLADYISNQLTLMVAYRSSTGVEVSRLATHRTVINSACLLSNVVIAAAWPELTSLHARSQFDSLSRVHRSLTKLNVWLVGAIILLIVVLGPWIYPAWTGRTLTLDPMTMTFLGARAVIWGFWSISMAMLLSLNQPRVVAAPLLGAALITGLLAIALVPLMGIAGAALAALLGDIAIPAWLIPRLATREIGDRFARHASAAGTAFLQGFGIPLCIGAVAWLVIPSQAARYFLLLPMFFSMCLWFMWRQLSADERSRAVALLGRK